ncbi:MAG: thioredoxin domain-containing protein [candidate division Zixibacteria bacterium]|nr:thioredoxin domain-containing protein [candidate division Zixibacteria bacterium]MDH3937223.1 thioredoxin domain-containing protein [candidate division Zixibacteria bacterium]MDH4034485.1 thioredoxin domain-containing protein [candidate division Zixibacteria bacterium]
MEQAEQTEHKHTNYLIDENSPYLLSHAHNPVNWYPWGDEALKRAREENKPIFLSIGYAACHWCHVMERESFEDETVAALLNEHFVSIKVDREQRPDLDRIYMAFTTAISGSGGWPMSVWLTPELKPFYAGTYFPSEARYGRPSFMDLLTQIATAYRDNPKGIADQASQVFVQVSQRFETRLTKSNLSREMLKSAVQNLRGNFDDMYGGFGDRPKFPHAMELSLFLRHFQHSGDSVYLTDAQKALDGMANGGIFDHLGGGFARYSTDRAWLVPHFEKMLYDNGLLVPLYVDAYQITGEERYLDIVRRSLDWLLREMVDDNGGIYSTLDADSEGEEGKFYVWSEREIVNVLGKEDAALFNRFYNVTVGGNFEGHNILNIDPNSRKVREGSDREDFDSFLSDCRAKLFKARSKRVRPLTDDKILTSWNGLGLTALCKGYQVTGDKRYLEAALKNADFVQEQLYRSGKLTHSFREGRRSDGEFLEDYAYYTQGLLNLYESDPSGNGRWLEFAKELTTNAVELFMDDSGVFYLRPANADDLIVRPRSEHDESVPAPASIMASNLLRLNRLTDEHSFFDAGQKALDALSGRMKASPGSMSSAMIALDYYLSDKIEIVLVGEGEVRNAMLEELYSSYLPNRIIAIGTNSTGSGPTPLFEGRRSENGEVKAYVCRNSVCKLPVSSVAELRAQLQGI